MEKQERRLNLVALASQLHCDALHVTPGGLSHTIVLISDRGGLSADPAQQNTPSIAFVRRPDRPREKAQSVLGKVTDIPWREVFGRDDFLLDRKILSRCSDFLTWPCDK